MASPLEIRIALHYWTTPGDYELGTGCHWHSTAVQETLSKLVERGLLQRREAADLAMYKRGPGLECYVKALCDISFPIQKWIIPPVDHQ